MRPTREYSRPMAQLGVELKNASGQPVHGRLSVLGADNRYYAPDTALGSTPTTVSIRHRQPSEVALLPLPERLFGDYVPVGEVEVVAWRGLEHTPVWQRAQVKADGANVVTATLRELKLS